MALNRTQINARRNALLADADAAYKDFVDRKITQKRFDEVMATCEREAAKLTEADKTLAKAKGFASCASPAEYRPGADWGASKGALSANVSPMDIPEEELRGMFEAIKHKQPYRCEITSKAFGAGSNGVGFKTPGAPIAEGAQWPTGLFPPQLRPELTQEFRYEPDRLADHIPTITIDAPSIEYLIHSGNTNPAAVVAELDPKPDLGMQLDTATAVPVKLAALASVSMEALADFSYFSSWVPRELSRALINEETLQLAIGTGASGAYPGMTGFMQTSDVLTRSFNSSTEKSGLDTLIAACTDIRVGPAYGQATVIALHPTTWSILKRTKTTTEAFVLGITDPGAIGSLNNLFGVPIVENSFIPAGQAIVADMPLAARYFVRQALTLDVNRWGDTEWTTNSISFRAEMRSVLAVLRPKAVCIVGGLPTGTGS